MVGVVDRLAVRNCTVVLHRGRRCGMRERRWLRIHLALVSWFVLKVLLVVLRQEVVVVKIIEELLERVRLVPNLRRVVIHCKRIESNYERLHLFSYEVGASSERAHHPPKRQGIVVTTGGERALNLVHFGLIFFRALFCLLLLRHRDLNLERAGGRHHLFTFHGRSAMCGLDYD